MPRLNYLKDWGYRDFNYYEVGDADDDSLEIEIELESDGDLIGPGLYAWRTARRRWERRQVFAMFALMSLPLLFFTFFHIFSSQFYTREMAPMSYKKINPFVWWYFHQ
jgi:hypothetical protein